MKDLIWAADLLRVLHDNLRLLVIGDGPERSTLERFARLASDLDHIRFLGHRDDVWRILPHLDVFWNGSGYEGQSNAVMEAMAAGVPVVASDIPGNRELVVHGETGFLVPIAGRAARARATDQILNDPALAARLGAAARQRMLEQFSVEENCRAARGAVPGVDWITMAVESFVRRKQAAIAVLALVAIAVHLVLRFGTSVSLDGAGCAAVGRTRVGRRAAGVGAAGRSCSPRVRLRSAWPASRSSRRCILGEYLAGTLVVLMLSGGETLEAYAVRSASSVLEALAKRMPSIAHRKQDSTIRGRAAGRAWRWATWCSSSRTKCARSTARWSRATA